MNLFVVAYDSNCSVFYILNNTMLSTGLLLRIYMVDLFFDVLILLLITTVQKYQICHSSFILFNKTKAFTRPTFFIIIL
ncbi:hypothetical protein AB4K20DRAFT_1873921 [Rhizopus microsporus]